MENKEINKDQNKALNVENKPIKLTPSMIAEIHEMEHNIRVEAYESL